MNLVRIMVGDVRLRLEELPSESVHCVVTSPPYWGLRNYGVDGQLGLEETPEAYVANMVAVFREVRRVLRSDGTLWLNLGDSYATGAGKVGDCHGGGEQGARWKGETMRSSERSGYSGKHGYRVGPLTQPNRLPIAGLKPKDLIGIPWRVAFALQADGWWLRQDIIWQKPNPMPESVTDRCTKAHEYIFLFTKSPVYYYDHEALKEPATPRADARPFGQCGGARNGDEGKIYRSGNSKRKPASARGVPVDTQGRSAGAVAGSVPWEGNTRNKRSVWTITTKPFTEAHFATFPPELPEACIRAGTSARGVCPKCGAPWKRMTETDRSFQSGSGRAGNLPDGKNGKNLQGGGQTLDIRRGPVTQSKTVGWEASCDCPLNEPKPANVFDPFNGAGTTGLVSCRLGRNYMGIELNPIYAEMSRRRIEAEAGMLAEVTVA